MTEFKDILDLYCEAIKQQPDKDIFTVEIIDSDNKIGENLISILAKKTIGLKLLEVLAKMEKIEPAKEEKKNATKSRKK